MDEIKCVVTGEASVGKSSIISTFVSECPSCTISRSGAAYRLSVSEVLPSELHLAGTVDVVVVVFAVDHLGSFKAVDTELLESVQKLWPSKPVLVVGHKADRRSEEQRKLADEGVIPYFKLNDVDLCRHAAKRHNAAAYLETSVNDKDSVMALFNKVVDKFLDPKMDQDLELFQYSPPGPVKITVLDPTKKQTEECLLS